MKLTDYQEIPEIDWHRRVMIGGWCVLLGFVIAVCLVTWFIMTFVSYPIHYKMF
jgi:uncharacterized BrkB/YihY/UPF0761 family membrane protein